MSHQYIQKEITSRKHPRKQEVGIDFSLGSRKKLDVTGILGEGVTQFQLVRQICDLSRYLAADLYPGENHRAEKYGPEKSRKHNQEVEDLRADSDHAGGRNICSAACQFKVAKLYAARIGEIKSLLLKLKVPKVNVKQSILYPE